MRNIRDIRKLPVSNLTDEEIVKAAMDRLRTRAVLLCYENPDNNLDIVFLSRYKKGGRLMLRQLQLAWEDKFGKWEKIENEESSTINS